MKRWLFPLAMVLALAGCVSVLAFGVRKVWGGRPVAVNAAARSDEADALRRAENALSQALSSHQALAAGQQRLVRESGRLAEEHTVLARRLDEVAEELQQLYKSLATDSRGPQLPKSWHQRLIEQNREKYTAIRDMLCGLTEDEFPTTRTWYGDAWRRLVKPFLEGQFPTPVQRDQLVKLLDDIMASERHRVAALEGQGATVSVVVSRSAVPAGYCLGTSWENLAQNLRDLRY